MTSHHWRRNLLLVSTAMIDASWMSLALIALTSILHAQPWYVLYLGIAAVLILLATLARWLSEQPIQWWLYDGIGLLVLLLLILLAEILYPQIRQPSLQATSGGGGDVFAIPPGILAAGAALLIWWRGFGLGQKSATYLQVGLNFRVGALLVLILSGIAPVSRQADALYPVGGFFFFGLLASAAARVEAKGQLAGVEQPLGPAWAGLLSLTSLATVVVSLVIGSLLPGTIRTIGHLLQPVGRLLLRIAAILFIVLSRLLDPFFLWLQQLMDNPVEEQPILSTPMPLPTETPEPTEPGLIERLLPLVAGVAIAIIALAVIAELLALLLVFLEQHRRQRRGDEGEFQPAQAAKGSSDESLFSAAWNRLRDWANLVARYGLGTQLYTALSVRTMYANVVRMASARGFPRQRARTPYEYLPSLQQAFPEGEAAAQRLTDAYVNVHYGQVPESRESLQSVRQAYDVLYQIAADAASRPP